LEENKILPPAIFKLQTWFWNCI